LKRENKNIKREENEVKQKVNITFADFHLDLWLKYFFITFI